MPFSRSSRSGRREDPALGAMRHLFANFSQSTSIMEVLLKYAIIDRKNANDFQPANLPIPVNSSGPGVEPKRIPTPRRNRFPFGTRHLSPVNLSLPPLKLVDIRSQRWSGWGDFAHKDWAYRRGGLMRTVLCILEMLDDATPNACGYLRLFLPLTKEIARERFNSLCDGAGSPPF